MDKKLLINYIDHYISADSFMMSQREDFGEKEKFKYCIFTLQCIKEAIVMGKFDKDTGDDK